MGTIISTSAAAKISAFFKVASFTAITGITTESKTGSVLIPANTIIDTGAGIEITARAIKTGVAGTLTARIYANTTDDLSGAVLLGTFVGSGTDVFVQLSRTLFIGKLGTKVFSPSATAFSSDDTRFTAAEVNQSINWADPQYIILSIQNSAAGDSSVGSGIMVKTINR
jgi:hypothetical protein